MVLLAYIGYAGLVFMLAGVAGTALSAGKGRAHSAFASPGWLGAAGIILGIPCYLVASYLRTSEGTELVALILVVCGGFGLRIGLQNRAGRR